MNWLTKLFGGKQQHKAKSGTFQVSRSGVVTNLADNPATYIQKGYLYNDIVYSIINVITTRIQSVKWGVYKEGRAGLRPFKEEALEDLLNNPNPYRNFSQIVSDHSAYKLLTGNSYLYAQRVTAGENEGIPQELWHLPPDQTDLVISRGFPQKILAYRIPGMAIQFEPGDILHTKMWNPAHDVTGTHLYGISPLRAALGLVNRTNSAMRTGISKLQSGGLESVLYVDDDRFTGPAGGDMAIAQAAALRDKLREYDEEGRRIAISGYKVGVAPLGLSPVELAILELEKWDLRRLCNVYGVPVQLLGDSEGSTFNNVKESAKALLLRVVIPLLDEFKDVFNAKLRSDWGGFDNVIIDYDQTGFTEFEEDRVEQMKWLLPLMEKGMPLNRVLDILNLEKIDDPYYDLPRVTQSMGDTLEDRLSDDSEIQNIVDGLMAQGNGTLSSNVGRG